MWKRRKSASRKRLRHPVKAQGESDLLPVVVGRQKLLHALEQRTVT